VKNMEKGKPTQKSNSQDVFFCYYNIISYALSEMAKLITMTATLTPPPMASIISWGGCCPNSNFEVISNG
jgi:hypothetical protein